ncbi:MAG TPA: gephyrin-like molybdotransferase Glp [Acetobacteraceae bacterium]|nr:gephyrin-like molybdotransferase Glp [Acetobacteraceae bacterium]
MAQLSDDCFAFGGKLQSVDAALDLITRSVSCVCGVESVTLEEADGRVLAADLAAPVDLPPFANSAVDGYAVRLADAEASAVLPVRGRLAAGQAATALLPGAAQRIFTGAPLPEGADTVFMQEDVELVTDGVRLPPGLKRGANTRPAGEDVAEGAVALDAGSRLRPQDVALAAALGLTRLDVRRRVRVAVLSTGDELVDPGTAPGPAQRFDSNRMLLAALCRRAGAAVTDLGIVPDRVDPIASALAAASRGHDLVLTTGGVSTGEEDHVRAALEAAGRLAWWRLAIKPGRPVAMGEMGDAVFLGLPGNPVAAFVTFVRLARPVMAALAGERYRPPVPLPVPAAFSYRKKAARREYVRVRLEAGQAYRYEVEGAGILTSLTRSDGLAEIADDVTRVAPGDTIGFLPFETLF